jgi:selT/selW/selH-like putative selenoprotein
MERKREPLTASPFPVPSLFSSRAARRVGLVDFPVAVPTVAGVDVQIVYCAPCGYRKRANDLADDLRRRFDAHVAVTEGKLGHFDVFVDGTLVASRGETLLARMLHKPPNAAVVVAAIEQYLAPGEGDHCELPTPEPKAR